MRRCSGIERRRRDSASATDKSLADGGTARPEPTLTRKTKKKGEGSNGGRAMKRPKKQPLGLQSITKATRLAAPLQRAQLMRDSKTGQLRYSKPGFDYVTAPRVPPASDDLNARSGKLKQARFKYAGKRPAPTPHAEKRAAPVPERGARTNQTHSTQSALYRFHKANGTLHEYLRMFGIEPT